MSYFSMHYDDVKYPIASEDEKGLRRAQIGAIHAVTAHFTLRNEPALIVMPTGSGKTAVLMMAAFTERASRVLVVTPSRLVRDQIREQFSNLSVLKDVRVLSSDVPGPKVHELKQRVSSLDEWNALREYDVVVTTPSSASPAIEGIPSPPDDLFDMILVDEAHHSPARTWNEIFAAFPKSKRILVTATPFRRDRREIRGRFVYVYPLKEAFKDQIFGKLEYHPVNTQGEISDVAIAKESELVLAADRKNGYRHYLMVRTDTRTRADILEGIYADSTDLKLHTVHSGHSYRHIKQTIRKLKDGELDGIICVDMLGEGFDLPNLKIAAIHTPHRCRLQ